MLTTLGHLDHLDDDRGWEDLPAYQRFDYTFRSGDSEGVEGFRRTTGVEILDYMRPANTEISALRFDSIFTIRVQSHPFVATWGRSRRSARRRFLFLFVTKGDLELALGDETASRVAAGQVAVLPPGPGSLKLQARVDCDFIAFSFDRSEVGELRLQEGLVVARITESAVFKSALAFLRGAVQSPRVASMHEAQVFRGLTRDVARALTRGWHDDGATQGIVADARRVIDAGSSSAAFSVGTIARELSLSRRSIERAFAEQGTSASDEIRERRAANANTLLTKHPELSIQEVAEASGFGSREGLRRALRRYYDATPAGIRGGGGSGEETETSAAGS